MLYLVILHTRLIYFMHLGSEAYAVVAVAPLQSHCEQVCMDHLMQQDVLHSSIGC